MSYLGEKMLGNFRPPITERSKKRVSAQVRREGNSKAYKALICKLRCCVTGQYGVDPHHLKSGPAKAERAAGRTATDRWLVPLSRLAHDELEFHKKGSSRIEEQWFRERGIPDVVALAAALYNAGKDCGPGSLERMERVLWAHRNGGTECKEH